MTELPLETILTLLLIHVACPVRVSGHHRDRAPAGQAGHQAPGRADPDRAADGRPTGLPPRPGVGP